MKRNTIFHLTAIYACIMLLILWISVSFLLRKMSQATVPPKNEPEYVYVYVSEEESEGIPPSGSDTQTLGWIMKEHNGKIGIFSLDGILLQELETYVKTLPEADRRLLGEGIYIDTRTKLNALIEDYTE